MDCYLYESCWQHFIRFYRQILLTESKNHPYGPKGTFITQFASALQGSFRYDPDWLLTTNVLDTSEDAKFVHGFFKSISDTLTNKAISLLDIPALMAMSEPYVSPLDVSLNRGTSRDQE